MLKEVTMDKHLAPPKCWGCKYGWTFKFDDQMHIEDKEDTEWKNAWKDETSCRISGWATYCNVLAKLTGRQEEKPIDIPFVEECSLFEPKDAN